MPSYDWLKAEEKLDLMLDELRQAHYDAGMHDGMVLLLSQLAEFQKSLNPFHCKICSRIDTQFMNFIWQIKQRFPELEEPNA